MDINEPIENADASGSAIFGGTATAAMIQHWLLELVKSKVKFDLMLNLFFLDGNYVRYKICTQTLWDKI